MALNDRSRNRLPSISEITEELLLQLRDHPETDGCWYCKRDQGTLIGEIKAGLYSFHYINDVSVYGCPYCLRVWYTSSITPA